MNDADKVPQVAIMLDDCMRTVLKIQTIAICRVGKRGPRPLAPKAKLTLMGYPLSLLNRLGAGTERHKVSFDNVLGTVPVQPRGKRR